MVLLFSHPIAAAHDPGPGHPEAPIRLAAINAAIQAASLDGLQRREAPQATLEQVRRVHPDPYPASILGEAPATGYRRLDPDTVMSPASAEAALRAAGAACAAVDAVVGGEARAAFCAMRPPGHHAEPATAMGFCLFNSVAIGAMQARHEHGLKRIAIFDFDVHHGNGTQAAFWNDPDTLYLSTHQSPLYPGTGAAGETGAHDNIVNCPLPAGTGSAAFRRAVETTILPRIDAFAPELVMVSAGFDAHMADPLAQLRLTEDDFAWVTTATLGLAAKHASGRVVSVLEGGYDPPALGRSVVAHLKALLAA
ncbi:MAG: histone deacetylase family protein [Geminicoccaceae bacterium]